MCAGKLSSGDARIRPPAHACNAQRPHCALAFALRFHSRKRVHNAHEIVAEIAAKRLVEHLERAGFVVMKRATEIGARPLGWGYEEA
jgi:hypothetical protein